MAIDRTVKFTVRLNMLNPAHLTINKVLNELNLDILKSKNQFFIIHANEIDISIYSEDLQNDYISLTDIAKKREGEYPGYVIQNWLRNKNTIAFIGLWESIHNPNFNCIEFEAIKGEAGTNSFVLTPKRWVESTNAIGIVTKGGRYAKSYSTGTYTAADFVYLCKRSRFTKYGIIW